MQLIKSDKNNYITGNPHMTFFKSVYKKHTNFAMEELEINFNSDLTTNECVVTAIIPKSGGDLLEKMYLDVLLTGNGDNFGTTSSDPSKFMRWTNTTGYAYIKKCRFIIDSQEIDNHTSEWFEIWNELTDIENKESILINKHTNTNDYYNNGDFSGTGVTKLRMLIPLQFDFCRSPGLSLPLIALQYSDIKIEFTFRKLDYLINCTNYSTASQTTIPTVKLFGNFIYLDSDERSLYAKKSHEYLIEQVQQIPSTLETTNKLNFNHMVKELIWICKNRNTGELDTTDSGNDTKTDITNSINTITSVTGNVDSTFKNNDYFNFLPNNNTYKEYTLNTEGCEHFDKGTIVLDGNEMFNKKDAIYFRLLQPHYYHLKNVNNFIYMYSFALFPEKHQPSGFCDFSKFKSITLNFDNVLPNEDLIVFAINYNILRISNGMGGLAHVS